MPAVDRGADVVASKLHSRRCAAPLKNGGLCKKWTTESTGWESCWQHSVSEAEWKAAPGVRGLAAAAQERLDAGFPTRPHAFLGRSTAEGDPGPGYPTPASERDS